MSTFPALTADGYHCPICDTPYPTATEAVLCQLTHGEEEHPS